MLELMPLYSQTDSRGRKYLAGRLGNLRVLIFRNAQRTSGRHPAARLYLAKIEAGGGELTPAERAELERYLQRDEEEVTHG